MLVRNSEVGLREYKAGVCMEESQRDLPGLSQARTVGAAFTQMYSSITRTTFRKL